MKYFRLFLKTIISLIFFACIIALGHTPVAFSQDGGDVEAYRAEVVRLTNAERAKAGLPPLVRNPMLDQAAQDYAKAMALNDFYSHQDPRTGTSSADRVEEAGYAWMQVAENIAAGQKTPEQVVEAWMNSPKHRANILNPDLKEIGVGYYYDPSDTFPNANTPYGTYWVQDFGTPNGDILGSPPAQPAGAGGGGSVSLTKSLEPVTAKIGDEVTVSLTLHANDILCDTQPVEQPVDVVLVMDVSTSMNKPDGRSKLDEAKDAALSFVSNINTGDVRVAIVTFDGEGRLIQRLTKDESALRENVTELQALVAKTAIHTGLRAAHQELVQNGRPDVTKAIVLLSDGANFLGIMDNNGNLDEDKELEAERIANDETLAEAEMAKAAGIRIITVGIGDDIPRELLTRIASTPSDVHFSPDASELEGIYVSIAKQLREYAKVTNLRITHRIDPAKIQVLPAEISNNGVLSGRTVKDTITWELTSLGEDAVTLTYKGILKQPGQYLIDKGDHIEYLLCETDVQTTDVPPGLTAQVPTPTPTPTPKPTSTPSPTPTITPTSGIFGAPTPTPTSGMTRFIHMPSAPPFCSNHLWWLPALVLPFLLALLLLLFLWWLAKKNHVSLGNLWKEWRWPCRIASLLLLLLLLLLAFLVGRELFVGSCKPAEAVYFWRMDPNSGESGIFLTTSNNESAPASFKELNRGRCVGCHAVSSKSHQIAAVHGPIPGSALIYSLSGEKVEAPDAEATYYAWSPDGMQLAYADSNGDIYIWDTKSHQSKPLQGASDPNLSETMPSWSPDGATIAFVRSEMPLGIGGASVEDASDIYTVPASGGQPEPLPGASGEGLSYYPAYSPDGKWLAFTHHTTGSRSYADDAAEIYLVPAAGGAPIRLEANDAADGSTLTNVSNSWPTWSQDGHLLAFNSKRNDPNFDVFYTEIDENGHSGAAQPLPGASQQGVFEHTPFWGAPLQPLPLWKRLLNLWPWLIPLLLLALLRWLLCRKSYVLETPPPGHVSSFTPPPALLGRWQPLPPEWQPAPTLVIGLGGTGRKTLTHLKKNLLDAGLGKWNEHVRLLLLDNAAEEIVNGQEQEVSIAGIQLEAQEMMIIGDDLRQLVRKMANDPDFEPEMQTWFPADEYARVRSLPEAQMDIRKSTNLRRPMGRALAFKDIQQDEASQLWQGLTQAMHNLSHGGQVRVLIVGSLAGGFGSGVLADVAYLVRRAAMKTPSASGIALSALLVTDNAFAPYTSSQQLQLNTKATLREVERLLLAGNRPFPMTYKKNASSNVLNGFIEWSLFDEVFLFDGQRPVKPLTLVEPERGMYPLLADIAQVFIDSGSQLMDEARSNLRTTAATEQVERGEAVVSTLGAYTYRLPMLDIVRGLTTRFAHDLVLLYLAGPNHDGKLVQLTAEQARRETRYPGGVSSMVLDFLRGSLYGQGEGAGAESNYVADLSESQDDLTAWRGLTADETTRHLPHYRKALAHLLLQILNGQPAEQDMTMARSGKLGYALAFLNQLVDTLTRAQERLDMVANRASDNEQKAARALADLITEEKKIAQAHREELQAVVTFLLGRKEEGRRDVGEDDRGVLSLLEEKLYQEKSLREELRKIVVRRTFFDEAFLDKLYKRYFAESLDLQGLAALYWRLTDSEELTLSIYLEGEEHATWEPTRMGREKFIHALIELASALGEDIWRVRLSDFFDDVDEGLWRVESKLRHEAEEASAWAEPTATVRVAAASQQEPNRYLWVNHTVESKDRFARQVQLRVNMRTDVQNLAATDPYSAMLLTSLDILPLSAFDCTQRVDETYRNVYGLSGYADYGEGPSYPEPVHVFAAEQHALTYERRLTELREAPRLFHPLFVAALEDLEKSRVFVWAYLLQWIHRERYIERGEPSVRYVLDAPGMDIIPLTKSDSPTDSVALIVRAMQNFVLGKGAPGSVSLPFSSDEMVRRVQIALEANQEHLFQAMQEIVRAKPEDLAGERRIGADDFWSFLRLISRDELRNL